VDHSQEEEAGADADADFETPEVLNKVLFFFTLVTGPGRSLSLKLGGTRVYEP